VVDVANAGRLPGEIGKRNCGIEVFRKWRRCTEIKAVTSDRLDDCGDARFVRDIA